MKALFAGLVLAWACCSANAAAILRDLIVRSAVSPSSTSNATMIAVDSKPVDTLEFLNGDTLRGTFLSVEPELGVRWRHDGIRDVVSVIPSKIRMIRLIHPRPKDTKAYNSKVILVNDDKLAGTFVSLEESGLSLDTWYAGTLNIPRSALRALVIIMGQTELVFEGPTGMEGWTAGANRGGMVFDGDVAVAMNGPVFVQGREGGADSSAWQFKDNALVANGNGSIGRDVKLPPSARIDFDVEYQGLPQFSVQFYADTIDRTYGGNNYTLQFSQRYIYLRRYSRPGSSRSVGSSESSMALSGKAKARIGIRMDHVNKAIAVYIDDVLIRKWTDIGELGGNGTGLLFWQQNNNQLKISNLQVSKWEPGLDEPSTSGPGGKEDFVVLKNQDKLSGQLKVIRNGVMEFKSAFSDLKIPLDRINWIRFAAADAQLSAVTNTAKLNFFDYGRVTLKIDRWDEVQVEGVSPAFGRAKLNPAAFNSVQFGP